MDVHQLRVLKFDDHSNKNAAVRKYCEDSIPYTSNNPMNDYPKYSGGSRRAKLVSGERRSRPRKRISNPKKRKSTSDLSQPSYKLKKHTRKRTLSLSDVTKSLKNSINCYPTKHTFDLLSGDSELHIHKKKKHRKKRKRHSRIKKDLNILFISETPRVSRKSRRRSNKHYRRDSSYNLKSSDDIFGFRKSNRTFSQYLYNANCNYFNTFKKIKTGFQRKKKGGELQPRRTRVKLLSTDHLSSISSLKHYNIVNTCRTKGGHKCLKLHSDYGRKTGNLSNNPTANKKVCVRPSSLANLGKCFCNRNVGTTKSLNRNVCGNRTQYQNYGTQMQQNEMCRVSREVQCPLHGSTLSHHEKSHPVEGSACICTQYPSGTSVDAKQYGANKTNHTDKLPCGTRTCSKNQYTRLYTKVLRKMTNIYSSPQSIAINVVKFALLGLLLIIWCPCIFAVGLAWIITYPLKLQQVISIGKPNKPSGISCLFSKFRKNHRGAENERMGCSPTKQKGFLSWMSNWSARAAGNIYKSINTLLSIFKINKNNPKSDARFCAPKHPNPERKYSLFYEENRGWIMKPVHKQEMSTPYHRNQVVQDVCFPFDAIRQKFARTKRQDAQQGSSLFRSPPTNNIGTEPTCWRPKSVHPPPCNQVITLPKQLNPNFQHVRNCVLAAKKKHIFDVNHIADKTHICNHRVQVSSGRNSLFGINASNPIPLELKLKETSRINSKRVHKKLQSINKCNKSTQYLSSKNLALPTHFPAYGIVRNSKPRCRIHSSNPYHFPNTQTKLILNPNQIQPCTHHDGLKIPNKYTGKEHFFSSNSVSIYSCNTSVNKTNTGLLKNCRIHPYKISQNPLASRNIDLSLPKLQCTLEKLTKYLEERKLTLRCLNEKKVKDSHLEHTRKQKLGISRFVPSSIAISNSCRCSGDNNLTPIRKTTKLDQMPTGSSVIKCTCINKKVNHQHTGIDKQHSTRQDLAEKPRGRSRVECSCFPRKQQIVSADNKSIHRSSKTSSPKLLKGPYPKESVKVPRDRYSEKPVNGNRVPSNMCNCYIKPMDNVHTQVKQKIEDNVLRCQYCKKKLKLNQFVCECRQGSLNLSNKRQAPNKTDSKQIRNAVQCKCQITKTNRVAEEPQLLSQHGPVQKKQAKINSPVRQSSMPIKDRPECRCQKAQLLPKQTSITTKTIEKNKVASKNVKRNSVACECHTKELHVQPLSKLLPDSSTTKSDPGSNVKCTCSGTNSTMVQHYPHDKVPLRLGKSDETQSKSLRTKQVTKSSQKTHSSQCACSLDRPKPLHDKQSKHSVISAKKINLKRSFGKMNFILPRCFPSDHSSSLSEKIHPEQVSEQELAKISWNNLQETSSREKFSHFLRKSLSKINSKLSQNTLSHIKCTCAKLKPLYDKLSQLSNKSSLDELSQRVRFDPPETTQHPSASRPPRSNTPKECACQSHHTEKIKTKITNTPTSKRSKLSQRPSTSSKERIQSMRNTINKLHSMLARYILSDIKCVCPDNELNRSLHKDNDAELNSQHQFLPVTAKNKKSKLTPMKSVAVECSCKQNELLSDSKTLVDKPNNGLFQYPPSQQAISPAQRHSTDQVTTSECACPKGVQDPLVQAPSQPLLRKTEVSKQGLPPVNDPNRKSLRYQPPSAQHSPRRQPTLRRNDHLPPETVNICPPTCISQRRKPWPPESRLAYPTLIPDPQRRQYAVHKRKSSQPETDQSEIKRNPTSKRRSCRTKFCNCCKTMGRTIKEADAEMWPECLHCNGRMCSHTLRSKPCYGIHGCCPNMYPCCSSFCSFAKSMCTMFLYTATLICWCPFICCIYLCCQDLCCMRT